MRVSVVIPCHNSLRWLPETLDAVLGQTHAELDVVLVDDGGDDDLAAWAAGRGDPRVRVVRQANAGVAAARNAGVEAATGELVAFCDSDDLWVPECVEWLVARFDEDPTVGLVYGWYDVVDADGRPTGRVETCDWEGDVWERFVTRNPVGMSGTLVPRSVFRELGGFEVNRDRYPIDVEDWALWIRLAAEHRVAVVREVVFHYRRHGTNSSSDTASLAAANTRLLERVFRGQPAHRLALRPRSRAHVDMVLAWHSLNDDGDPEAAMGYLRSAVRHRPELRADREWWRAVVSAVSLRLLGSTIYGLLRGAGSTVRRRSADGEAGTLR